VGQNQVISNTESERIKQRTFKRLAAALTVAGVLFTAGAVRH
jgi:hypothetical protein